MRRSQAWLLLFAILLAYAAPLGLRPLRVPDEVRYAEISREMIATGDWIVPRLLGRPYFEKPVGAYWLNNLSQIAFGPTNFAVRFMSASSTVITALLVMWLGLLGTGDRRKAWLAGLVYLSSFMVWGVGTDAVLDPMLTMWLTAALGAFWCAFTAGAARRRFGWWSAFGGLCGCAFLTKGFVALAVPVVSIAPLMLWHRRWRELLGYGSWSVVVAAAVAAPWSLSVHAQAPDYWRYFFWEEHIRRFAGEEAQHAKPFWFFVPVMLGIALPWTGAVPAAVSSGLRASRRGDAFHRFLLLAVVMPLLLFSAAKGKLATYILPCFGPLAILIADAIGTDIAEGGRRALRMSAWFMLGLSATLLATLLIVITCLGDQPYIVGQNGVLLALGAGLVLWIGLLAWVVRSGGGHVFVLSMLTPCVAIIAPFAEPHPWLQVRMPQAMVRESLKLLPADCAIASSSVTLAPLLAWESRRVDVVIVGGAGELGYGLGYPEGRNRRFDDGEFPAWLAVERAHRPVALFLIGSGERRAKNFPVADRIERGSGITLLCYDRRQ